jgi:hypothetical protein
MMIRLAQIHGQQSFLTAAFKVDQVVAWRESARLLGYLFKNSDIH